MTAHDENREPGHEAAGHEDAGHEAAGHEDAGHEAVGREAAGHEDAGREAAGYEAAGHEAVGREAVGYEAAGREAAGREAAGREAAGREAAGREAAGREAAGREDAGYEAAGREDTAYDGGARDGMDALMAAILDEEPPAAARWDPAFVAAHGAAVADLAVLRERLAFLGDALAGPGAEAAPAGTGSGETGTRAGAPAGRGGAARPGRRPDAEGRSPAGGGTGDGARDRAAAHAPLSPRSPRPGGSRGPHRPHRPRRLLKTALGALAAAAAATVVVGMGWLVAQPQGVSDGAADKSAAAQSDSGEAGGAAFGSPGYLACARLVAEGTVEAVEPVPGSGQERVTLAVSRHYKGAREDEVTFLLDVAAAPAVREGDAVLVGLPPGGAFPDRVVVGAEEIAGERARITAALPESRTLTCG